MFTLSNEYQSMAADLTKEMLAEKLLNLWLAYLDEIGESFCTKSSVHCNVQRMGK